MHDTPLRVKARLRVHQERPYFDKGRGLWLARQIGEDEDVPNIVTDGGRVAIHTFIYGTASDRTAASLGVGLHHIGLTDDASAPAAGDTTLTAELTADGLIRVAGATTMPTGSGTQTVVQNTFTYTGGAPQTVQKTALFDAVTGGNMAHEIQFVQRTLFTNDTLTVTFTITLT